MIEKTILSVLGQKYRDFEYIVIDGGSTDGTLQILEKYASQDKLKFVSEPDNGMYDAINKGFGMGNGEICGYLNTDDLYFPWTLERVAHFFDTHSDIDLLFGDTLVYEAQTNICRLNIYPSFSRNWLFCGAIIPQPTVFFRRAVFEKVGPFAREIRLIGDCEYWLRAMAEGFRAQKLHEFLAVENNHGTTLRNRFRDQIKAEKKQLIACYARDVYRFKLVRNCLLRLKYMEKELLILWFAFKNWLSIRSGRWCNFLSAYDIRFHSTGYIGSKLRLQKQGLWTLKCRETDRTKE